MSDDSDLFNQIKILDCTLRDGGHLNKWRFSKDFASRVCSALSESSIYCVEVGYVSKKDCFPPDTGIWRFSSEEDIRSVVSPGGYSKIAVMGDICKVELSNFIDKDDSIIDLVRLAFYPGHLEEAIQLGEQVMDKGYEVSMNLMAITRYPKVEIESAISSLYRSRIENIFIADSYGSLLPNQVYDLIRSFKVGTGKNIGFHAHNNLELAFANSIKAAEAGATIIDTTIYGIGRGAGNLPLEVLLSYISSRENRQVNMIPLLELIEDEFIKLKNELGWGYGLPYLLTGMLKCHPNYATELRKKYNLPLRKIWPLLVDISGKKPIAFDKNLLKATVLDSDQTLQPPDLGELDFSVLKPINVNLTTPEYMNKHSGRDFLVLGQGPSLKDNIKKITEFVKNNNLIVLGANYLQDLIIPDYHAFSNYKRFSHYVSLVNPHSKLLLGVYFSDDVIRKYTNHDFEFIQYVDDSTTKFGITDGMIQTNCGTVSVLLIAVAIVMGARKIYVAGLDGYKQIDGNATHFYDEKEKEKGRERISIHNLSKRYLEEIRQYQLAHGLEPFKIITPTFYSDYYCKVGELE